MSTHRQFGTSDHAVERFRDRASWNGGTVDGAWLRGEELDIPIRAPVPDHDEARYDPVTDVVIFQSRGTIMTCYGLGPEHVTNIYGVAVAAAVDEQHGTNYCSRIDPRNLEDTN